MAGDFDWLLTGGEVLDGTGAPAVRAEVGIRGDRIAAVGDLSGATAGHVLECAGLTVSPGFVDAHSHSDAYLLLEPQSPSKLHQGITTEIVGHCGASAAPLDGKAMLPMDWASFAYPGSWRSVAEYRSLLERSGFAPNVMMLAGHRNLRMERMGNVPRAASREEVAAMARSLEDALDQGAGGLSTGLVYEPSRHAKEAEIDALARVVSRRQGVYATHLRDEGAHLLEALEEAIGVARRTGVSLQIAHLKTSGRANWPLAEAAVEAIESARRSLRIHADRYPYLASGTELDVLLPSWAGEGGREAILARLRDPRLRRRILDEMKLGSQESAAVWVGGTWSEQTHAFRGKNLDSAASALGLSSAETLLWIVERDGLRTGGFFFHMCEENLRLFLSKPWVMAGSDASLRSPQGPLSKDHPHPRAYGSHARMLAMAREDGSLSLAETVRRMTQLPAGAFGLKQRGTLSTGQFADVAVFDAATVRDCATFAEPHRFATGIRHVLVNGRPVLRDGRLTEARPGRWLRGAAV